MTTVEALSKKRAVISSEQKRIMQDIEYLPILKNICTPKEQGDIGAIESALRKELHALDLDSVA
jgi:hypothetical protein